MNAFKRDKWFCLKCGLRRTNTSVRQPACRSGDHRWARQSAHQQPHNVQHPGTITLRPRSIVTGDAVVIEVLLCGAAIDGLGNAYRLLYGVSNHEILTTRHHPIWRAAVRARQGHADGRRTPYWEACLEAAYQLAEGDPILIEAFFSRPTHAMKGG